MVDILYESFSKLSAENKEEYIKEHNKYIAEVKKTDTFNEDIKLKVAFLRHNARCTLFEEIKELLVELINKYKNKPFGEKTRRKFRDEFFEKTNKKYYVYIDNNCDAYIKISTNYNILYDLTIYFRNNEGKLFDILKENRLQEVNVSMLECEYNKDTFIKDIEQRIVAFKESYIKVYQAQEFLEKHMDEHNELCVMGLDTFYNKNHIRKKYC